MKIKWKRLKRIASGIVKRQVEINLTTDSGLNGYNALVEFNKDKAMIFLNGNKCKSLSMVINAIAHELAHVLTGETQDSNKHKIAWDSLKEVIKKEYGEL